MNSFFNVPGIQNMMPPPMRNMMNVMRQVQQIKQNPNQLATLLKQRGMIDEQQAAEIQKMGSNYEQIRHYLMDAGRMPTNVQQYESQLNDVQNMLNKTYNIDLNIKSGVLIDTIYTIILFILGLQAFIKKDIRSRLLDLPMVPRCLFTAFVITLILVVGIWGPGYDSAAFIYFQF